MLQTGEIVEVDAVPVLAPAPQQGYALIRSIAPATQAMAVAAGGFVLGAAVVGLVGRRHGRAMVVGGRDRRSAKGRSTRKASRAGELVRIVGTRSLLVDVHLLEGGR